MLKKKRPIILIINKDNHTYIFKCKKENIKIASYRLINYGKDKDSNLTLLDSLWCISKASTVIRENPEKDFLEIII